MLQLAKFLGLFLVIIDLISSLFFFLFVYFIKLIKFLGFIFNYDYLLNANYFSLVPTLLNNCINKNIPEVVIKYKNAEKYRAKILKENKGKSGVYLITNEINKDIYVGISYDLAKRLGKHTNIKYINNYRWNSILYNSIKKYGLENWKISILEFCDKDSLIDRENYFIKLLQPVLNIAKIAGAPFTGRFHSEKTKKQMSKFKKGINPTIAIAASNQNCSFPV
jgi:hypothetical protein